MLALEDDQRISALARVIVAQGLSVREVENRARLGTPPRKRGAIKASGSEVRTDPAMRHAEEELRRALQTDVRLAESGPARGRIEISYYSTEDLERLIDLMIGARRASL